MRFPIGKQVRAWLHTRALRSAVLLCHAHTPPGANVRLANELIQAVNCPVPRESLPRKPLGVLPTPTYFTWISQYANYHFTQCRRIVVGHYPTCLPLAYVIGNLAESRVDHGQPARAVRASPRDHGVRDDAVEQPVRLRHGARPGAETGTE